MAAERKDSIHVGKTGIEARFIPAQTLTLDESARSWTKTKATYAVSIQVNLTPVKNGFAQDYNYPTFAIGIRHNFNHGTTMRRDQAWGEAQPVDYTSKLGDFTTLYGTFSRPIYRSRSWQWGYTLGTGIGYTPLKYNLRNDIDNEYIGSHWNIYFTAGIYGQYRLSRQISLKGGIDYSHHSNGALARPNKGANYLGPFIGLLYEPERHSTTLEQKSTTESMPFIKHWYMEIALGGGGKTLLEEWQQTQFNTPQGAPGYRTDKFPFYGAFSFHTNLLYRYARRWASGIGIGVFYGDYSNRLAEIDKQWGYENEKHSPWSLGIEGRHTVFYGKLSLRMGLGYYLYRHMGHSATKEIERPYYEQIGVFYSFPRLRNITVGFNVNAHSTKADFTELQIVLPVKLTHH
ncbi:MAG: acyloxyacyl hydrolase [Prevotella sp.]|nr:acyloxyacyl hydrolase [Prevotella sp.]